MSKKIFICVIILLLVFYYVSITYVVYNNNTEQELIHQIINIDQHTTNTDECNDNRSDDLADHKSETMFLLKDKQETTSYVTSFAPSGFDCIIKIPCIDLEKIVYTGNEREIQLQNYFLITAAEDMTYSNGGNYIICGHDSQLYGHSLNRLDEIQIGEQVFIYWENEIHEYRTFSKKYESMTNTSSFCKQTEKRELTIISCAKHIGSDQYIVIRCELNK